MRWFESWVHTLLPVVLRHMDSRMLNKVYEGKATEVCGGTLFNTCTALRMNGIIPPNSWLLVKLVMS